jgi:hypothetical protein
MLKDNDLRIRSKFFLFQQDAAELKAQLRRDADFLTKLNVLDYSLLGIHTRESVNHILPSFIVVSLLDCMCYSVCAQS